MEALAQEGLLRLQTYSVAGKGPAPGLATEEQRQDAYSQSAELFFSFLQDTVAATNNSPREREGGEVM
jgi:hypothetical protein